MSARASFTGGLGWAAIALGLFALAALSLLFVVAERAQRAQAATIINVTTTTDELNADGDCALREAIQAANTDAAVDACPAGSGADTINVPAGAYTLTIAGTNEDGNLTGDLDILTDVTINGLGAISTIIQACDSSGGPCTGIDRVLHSRHPAGPSTVNISRVNIRNASEHGSIGNEADGTLNLSESVVTANMDGGIVNDGGTLNVSNSSVVGNSGDSGGGGGILSTGGSFTLASSTVSGNVAFLGGGIYVFDAMVTITDSTISNNSADSAGGIYVDSGAVTISSSTVSGNEATLTDPYHGWGGGIFNFGSLKLNNSSVRGNTASNGAGIYSHIASLTVTGTTINDNESRFLGGGIYNYVGPMNISNSTISDNRASENGGGIFEDSQSSSVASSTLVGNSATSGGGILANGSPPTMKNSIVANSPSGGNCSGAITSLGNNLSSDGSCAFASAGDMNSANPMLGPLANNGGPTQTHGLLAGSPAIDAGSGDCPPPATDQRGVSRPQDGDGNSSAICDNGAFEATGPATPGPVGGIALDAERSSGGDAGLLAGAIAFVGVALGGAVWYARRRR